jgi:hypothetical protein
MPIEDQKSDTVTRDWNAQALALAEQLGRIAGTLEGTAEAWLNRASITDQLTKVRDGATQLLNSLGSGAANGRRAAQKPAARSARREADPAHAAGKRHRQAGPTVRGAKKSNSVIPKAKASAAARRRRKSYA